MMSSSVVKVIRSARRRRTVQAKEVDGEIWVYLPRGLTVVEERQWIDRMVNNLERQRKRRVLNSDGMLLRRAQELNQRYFDGVLDFSICFVTNQHARFGSCSSSARSIRVSDRVATMPRWVQDYVILHELTHLVYPDHSKRFWAKVHQYKYAERARGYLIAVGLDADEEQS